MIIDIPFSSYLALDCASFHRLWKILKSPKALRWDMLHPTPPDESMNTGTGLHALLLEEKEPLCRPKTANRRSNEGKSNLVTWLEEMTGHEAPRPPTTIKTPSRRLDFQIEALEKILDESHLPVFSEEQVDRIRYMRDSIMHKATAKIIFGSGRAEATCLQDDPVTGLKLKSRFDWLSDHFTTVVDVKTTKSVRPCDFERDAEKYGYRMQMSFYRWMYELEFNETPTAFICSVENAPPFDSIIYEVGEDMIEDGNDLFRKALDIYEKCMNDRFWPGYDWDWDSGEFKILTLNRPRWAKS